MWQEQKVHWLESSELEVGKMVGYCEHSNGTGASTMLRIYFMEVKGVYSLPETTILHVVS